ncbi:MAG: hypothetical protein HHJ11_19660 [Phycicoccus sp.]|nr:hypothetical protein [Phycicoccus sp.]NMM34383.1 hypothetical protein [Phycicoccus sp.]
MLAEAVAGDGDGALVVAVVGAEGVVPDLGALDVERAAWVELGAVLAAGEPELQAARARLVRATAMVVPRAVLLRRTDRSLRRVSGDPSLPLTLTPLTNCPVWSAGFSILSCSRPSLGKGH